MKSVLCSAEVVIAPSYEAEAIEILKGKKNRIILVQKEINLAKRQFRTILNGVLEQDRDAVIETEEDLKCSTTKEPTSREIKDLLFAK